MPDSSSEFEDDKLAEALTAGLESGEPIEADEAVWQWLRDRVTRRDDPDA